MQHNIVVSVNNKSVYLCYNRSIYWSFKNFYCCVYCTLS